MKSKQQLRIIMLLLVFVVSIVANMPNSLPRAAGQTTSDWREAQPVKVIIDSTSDWGRILFDDLNGTNTNGLRVHSVISTGWSLGEDENDVIDAGRKIPWPDTVYNNTITRKGDMVTFFKGLGNFHYTEAYADLVLEVDISLPQVYVWLMVGGNGTTTFEIASQASGGTIWRDVLVGNGETQQVKRIMTPQPFFQTGRTENVVVIFWLMFAVVLVVLLNFPVIEVARRMKRKLSSRQNARK